MQRLYHKVVSRTALSYFLILMVTTLLQLATAVVIKLCFPGADAKGWYNWVLSYVPLYAGGLPLGLLLLRLAPARSAPPRHRRYIAPSQYVGIAVLCLGAMYLLNIVSTLISMGLAALLGSEATNVVEELVSDSSMWYAVVFGCLITPLGEEYLFRKLLYEHVGAFGQKQYVMLSALIFALFHGNLSQALYAFAVGAIFAYIYSETGNLWYSIGLHAILNFFGMVLGMMTTDSKAFEVVFFCIIGCFCIASVVLAVRWLPQVRWRPGRKSLPSHPVGTAVWNLGMLLYLATFAVIAFATLMTPAMNGGAA